MNRRVDAPGRLWEVYSFPAGCLSAFNVSKKLRTQACASGVGADGPLRYAGLETGFRPRSLFLFTFQFLAYSNFRVGRWQLRSKPVHPCAFAGGGAKQGAPSNVFPGQT